MEKRIDFNELNPYVRYVQCVEGNAKDYYQPWRILYDNFFSGTNNRSGKGITKKQVEFDKKLGLGFFFRLMKMRCVSFRPFSETS